MKKFFQLCFLLLISFQVYGQKLKTLIAEGNKAMEDKEYYLAENYFKKAIATDSNSIALQYLYAEACRLDLNYTVAERWYNKVYKKDNGKLYPDALLYLAICKKSNGKYKDAIKMFDKYAKRNTKKHPEKSAVAAQESKNCSYALMLIKNPLPLLVNHIDSMVNSKGGEYAPFEKDSVLYFTGIKTAGNKIDSRIYYSKVSGYRFSKLVELDSLLRKEGVTMSNVVLTPDGKQLYCTRCESNTDTKNNCGIYSYRLFEGKYTAATPLPAEINQAGTLNTHPSLHIINGNTILYFSSNRKGGEGGMDIWYSQQNKDGSWQTPVNAGKQVNSPEDEITPFFCNPCQTLYFSSTFHQGMGGFDIFKSRWQNGQFSSPENAGYPINSPQNDMYFKYNDKRSKAYFISNREGSYYEKYETCCNDIYYINLPQVTDSIVTEEPQKDTVFMAKSRLQTLVPLTLYFNNDEPDSKTLNTTTKKTYTETVNSYLALKNNYLKAYAKGLDEERKEIAMNEMNDFFEDSVRASYEELEQFASLMLFVLKQGEKVSLTLKGYCSPLASTSYNVNLAKRRLSSLVNYFNTYGNGALKPYLEDESKVKINIEEIGELKASPLVSDNPNDATNAVYSRAAALERKIQIIAVSTKVE
ncbi:MAG: tetratricopeptide repeat protein [Bacteroidia bacterium]